MFIQKLGKCIYSERYIYLPCLFDSCLVLLLRLCLCVCSVVSDCFKPVDCSLPGSSVHGIFQASLLEWVAISFSRNLPTQGSNPHFLALTRRFFTHWATLSILFFFKILDIQFTPSAYLLSVCYMLGIVVTHHSSCIALMFNRWGEGNTGRSQSQNLNLGRPVLEISSRKLEIPREHFMQRWAR